jgi:DNA modification methylase
MDQKLKDIAGRFKQDYTRLSEIYSTAVAYPPGKRKLNVPFYRHEVARAALKRVNRAVTEVTGRQYEVDAVKVLEQIEAAGITKKREATSHLITAARKKVLPVPVLLPTSPDIINQCHHCSVETLLVNPEFPTVQVGHLDPPYGQFIKTTNGKYDTSSSVGITDCDNETEAEAIPTTCESLRLLAPRMDKERGVIFLWQACRELRVPILQTIHNIGWVVDICVTWNKGRPQAANYNTPFTPTSELLWVLKREGTTLVNCDSSSRDNVLEFAPVQQSTASLDERHMFEKPAELMEFLVGKCSRPGDIVADLFGCSGSMSVASAKLGRNWIYCESNPKCFALGSSRIASTVNGLKKAVG